MIKINTAKTFLKPPVASRSAEGRLQEGISRNIKACKYIYNEFDDSRALKLSTFKRVLRELTGDKINIRTIANDKDQTAQLSTSFWGKTNKFSGYTFKLPVMFLTDKIGQSSLPSVFKETQKLFTIAFNPKFLARKVAMLNKKHDLLGASDFFMENISGQKKLNLDVLDKLLVDKNYSERINILQFLRYDLMLERNGKIAEPLIDKQIEKMEHIKFVGKDYDFSKCNYDEKLDMLNTKLSEVIQKARELIQSSPKSKRN